MPRAAAPHLRHARPRRARARARPTSPGAGSSRAPPLGDDRCPLFPRVDRTNDEGDPRVRDDPSHGPDAPRRRGPGTGAAPAASVARRRPHRHRRVREGGAAGGEGHRRREGRRLEEARQAAGGPRHARRARSSPGSPSPTTPEALVGKTIVLVANLKPAKLMGVESNGMVLAGSLDGKAVLCTFDAEVAPGHEGEVTPSRSPPPAALGVALAGARLPGRARRRSSTTSRRACPWPRPGRRPTCCSSGRRRPSRGSPTASTARRGGAEEPVPLVEGRGRGGVPVGRASCPRVAVLDAAPYRGVKDQSVEVRLERHARRALRAERRPPPLPDRASRGGADARATTACASSSRRRPRPPTPTRRASTSGSWPRPSTRSSPDPPPTRRSRTCSAATRRDPSPWARRRASPAVDPRRPGRRALRPEAAARRPSCASRRSSCRRPGPRRGAASFRVTVESPAAASARSWSRVLRRAGEAAGRAGRCGCPAAPATSCASASRWARRRSPPLRLGPLRRRRGCWERAARDPLQPGPLSPADDARADAAAARRSAGSNVLLVILDAGARAVVRGLRLRPADDARDRPHRRGGRRLRARLHAGRVHARGDVVGLDLAVPRPPPQRGVVLGPPARRTG